MPLENHLPFARDRVAQTVGGSTGEAALTIGEASARPCLMSENDTIFMKRALELAKQAQAQGEVPVGAVVVENGQIVAEAFNLRETERLCTAHAELKALEIACRRLSRWRLTGCTIYVTLEPCVMCAGALVNSRIDRVVFGASDPKAGAVVSLFSILTDRRLNHRPEVVKGILADECGQLLTEFFRRRR